MKHWSTAILIVLCNVHVALGRQQCGPEQGACCVATFTPGCNDPQCCEIVCEIIPLCCEGGWFESCASLANELCPSCGADCGDDAAGSCCEVHAGPFCNDANCCEAVCAELPGCCEDGWSQACVDLADKLCPQCPPSPQTCEGFCGGQSSGGCFCDHLCCSFLDCCQDFCEFCPEISCCTGSCPADFDKDGEVDGGDLGVLLLAWGQCRVLPCTADLTFDGQVDGQDLGELLLNWGECR